MIQSINTVIREASANELDELQRLSVVTFTDTFAVYNTPENMQMYIDQQFNRDKLLEELESKENFFFIATIDGVPAGYVKLRIPFEQHAALKDKTSIELERIYVLKKFQGTGLGYKLMQYSLDYAARQGYDILWLGVWDRNEKAIKFYEKCGFEIFGEHEFILGTDEQIDYLMKKDLSN